MNKKKPAKKAPAAPEPQPPCVMDKACNISAFADDESLRYVHGAVRWDATHRVFCATASCALAIVPPPRERNGQPAGPSSDCLIPRSVLASAAADYPRRCGVPEEDRIAVVTESEGIVSITTKSVDGQNIRTAKQPNGKFPPWPKLLPKRDSYRGAMWFDAKDLRRLAAYFESLNDYPVQVAMLIPENLDAACEFVCKLEDGRTVHVIQMPCISEGEVPKCASELYPVAEHQAGGGE